MSNLYKKIYDGENILDYYEYTIKKLKKENKELKEQLNKDITNKRIQEALKKLKTCVNHYKMQKYNNTITQVIDILEGKNE